MGDSTSRSWLGPDGRRREGDPPAGWQQSADGRWFPPVAPTQPIPPVPTTAAPPSDTGGGLRQAYGRWPRWARIAAPAGAAFLVLALIGAATTPNERKTSVEAALSTTTEEIERATTPPTTAPPTTAPPATAPPPPPTAAPAPPPSPPQQSGGCDPNYSGCVPIASDVDCAGGSGNGPAYVSGPVNVIGSDIYGLDADHDGVGCE